jgi:hypothetical protein
MSMNQDAEDAALARELRAGLLAAVAERRLDVVEEDDIDCAGALDDVWQALARLVTDEGIYAGDLCSVLDATARRRGGQPDGGLPL